MQEQPPWAGCSSKKACPCSCEVLWFVARCLVETGWGQDASHERGVQISERPRQREQVFKAMVDQDELATMNLRFVFSVLRSPCYEITDVVAAHALRSRKS